MTQQQQQQLITFSVGDQTLGADIMAIREIRAWSPATPVPNSAPHVRGVVNLRGVILPVIDLSARFGWGVTEPTGRHVIIVVRIGSQLHGLIVDAVSDIVSVDPANLQPMPEEAGSGADAFVDGVVVVGDRLILQLDLARLSESAQLPMEQAA